MKAMVITRFGGPEVFEARDWPTPEPGPNQLRVLVKATAINPVDYKIRAHGSWAGIQPPAILGWDVAGVVDAAGPGVKDFKAGDEVFYTAEIFGSPGTYAEFHVVSANIVARKPRNLDFAQAASLPLAGCTALDAMHFFDLRPGQTALIHAAAGGVGSLAVQMAKASGARVFGTCRNTNVEFVRSLGAEPIDYRSEDYVKAVHAATEGLGVDAVYDTVGGDTIARSLEVVRPGGRIAGIVNTTGDINAGFRRNVTIYLGFMQRSRAKMEELRVLAERGLIKPLVDSTLPLLKVADAHRRLEAGGVRGKIVLNVA